MRSGSVSVKSSTSSNREAGEISSFSISGRGDLANIVCCLATGIVYECGNLIVSRERENKAKQQM